MSELERWFEHNTTQPTTTADCGPAWFETQTRTKYIARRSWTAALEWVLIKCKKEDLWYRDVINQELKAIKDE